MIDSGSSISTYMDCPRKYFYAYERRLEPPGYSPALVRGSFTHAYVEEFTSGNVGAVMRTFNELSSRTDESNHPKVKADMRLANGFFDLWKARWASGHPFGNDKLEFKHSELEWQIKIDEHTHVGKSDGVVLHKEYGKLFLYELKTATDRDRDSYIHRLEIDKQISSNLMALSDMGIECDGVIYDVIWKPGVRMKKDETPDELDQRMLDVMAADPAEYFTRHLVYRSPKAITEHIQDLVGQFGHMALSKATGNYYRNTGACDNYGKLCPYFSICLEGHTELENVFRKRDRKLPELSKEVQNENSQNE